MTHVTSNTMGRTIALDKTGNSRRHAEAGGSPARAHGYHHLMFCLFFLVASTKTYDAFAVGLTG